MSGLIEMAGDGWKESLRRIETSDPILGGEYGPLNAAQKVLGWRTKQLLSIVRSQGNLYRGQIWSPPQLSSSPLRAVAYSPKLRRLVAVGGVGGSATAIRTSDDGGGTWVERTLIVNTTYLSPFADVVWSAKAGVFFLLVRRIAGTDANLWYSYDGIEWHGKDTWSCPSADWFLAAVPDGVTGLVYSLPISITTGSSVVIRRLNSLATDALDVLTLNDPAVTSTMQVADWYYDRTTGFVAIGDRRIVRWQSIGVAASVVSLGTASTLFRRIVSDGLGNGHLFVCGYDSTGGGCVYWSDDGGTYAALGSFEEKNDWRAVAYDPVNKAFVALAGVNASTEHRVRTWYFGGSNGFSGWQRRSVIAQCYPFEWEDAVYADGAIVAVGAASDGGSSGATATSGLWFPY